MKKFFAGLSLIALTSACASQPEDIQSQYISPTMYQDYSCKQMSLEMQRLTSRVSSLNSQLKSKAEGDTMQMGVGLVIFWPALFFLEGGDGSEAAEYSRLKGEFEALETQAIQKNCDIKIKMIEPEKDKEEVAKPAYPKARR